MIMILCMYISSLQMEGERTSMNLEIEWGTMIYSLIVLFIVLAIIVGIPSLLIILFFQRRKNRVTDYAALEKRVQQLEEELRK